MKLRQCVIFLIASFGIVGCGSNVSFSSVARNANSQSTTPPACQNGEGDCVAVPVTQTYNVPAGTGKADILLVVDTTPAMFVTIQQLGQRLGSFLKTLDGVDWQVAVLNASMNSYDTYQNTRFLLGDLIPLNPYPDSGAPTMLTPSSDNAQTVLNQNLDFYGQTWGDNNSGDDFCDQEPFCTVGPAQPMLALQTAMTNHADAGNSGFFRPGAALIPVIISAADENGGKPNVQPSAVVNTFNQALGGSMAMMRGYSIIIQPGDTACLNQYSSIFNMGSGGQYAPTLQQFAQTTGGQSYSICLDDYDASLATIAQGLAPAVTTITLTQPPVQGSVQVTSSPAAQLTYSVTGSTITFGQPPPPGSTLTITYLTPAQAE